MAIRYHSLGCRCRSPHGERGLKSLVGEKQRKAVFRSPHGERGLKSYVHGRQQRVGLALLMESVD